MPTDDEIYRVEDVFLGPRETTLPFRVRYRAYAIGIPIAVTVVLIESSLRILSVMAVLYAIGIAIAGTNLIMRHVDYERSVRSWIRALWHEVNTPRHRTRKRTTFRPQTNDLRRSRS